MNPLQEALRDSHAFQCGFCTPGFVMQITALLRENPTPTEAEIRETLVGQHLPVHRLRDDHQRRARSGRDRSGAMTDTRCPRSASSARACRASEDPRILTGRGRYVDDIQLPGMLHATFVRSPVAARAASRRVDVSEARALPGVVAVYTGDDIQALLIPARRRSTLFPGLPASPFTHPRDRQGAPRRRSDRARDR